MGSAQAGDLECGLAIWETLLTEVVSLMPHAAGVLCDPLRPRHLLPGTRDMLMPEAGGPPAGNLELACVCWAVLLRCAKIASGHQAKGHHRV